MKDSEFQAILQARAKKLAAKAIKENRSDDQAYLSFRLGEEEQYGIPYNYLEEVLKPDEITPVPCTPSLIAGIVNRRSELLTVLDLKQCFNIPKKSDDKAAQVIVVRGAGKVVGILTDQVLENGYFSKTTLSPPFSSNDAKNMVYIQGIHQGKITILNIGALLNDPDIQVKLVAR